MERKIKIPQEIYSYLWSRYLPETTFKTYGMVGYLQMENLTGAEATNQLMGCNLEIVSETGVLREEKERVLKKLGYEYPKTRKDDIEILLKYTLVKIGADKEGNLVYVHNSVVPRPEEVLDLDEEEKAILENIRFEIKHQNAFNNILTLLINSNGNLLTSLEYIYDTTKIKLADIKEVLAYLVEEGSIKVKADKEVMNLRKADKVYVSINKEVFEQKRFVIS